MGTIVIIEFYIFCYCCTEFTFSARPLGLGSSLWFRKNEMLRYIREAGYVLFWTCFGEKQFFTGGWGRQISGAWSGFYYLDKDGNITGNNRFFG